MEMKKVKNGQNETLPFIPKLTSCYYFTQRKCKMISCRCEGTLWTKWKLKAQNGSEKSVWPQYLLDYLSEYEFETPLSKGLGLSHKLLPLCSPLCPWKVASESQGSITNRMLHNDTREGCRRKMKSIELKQTHLLFLIMLLYHLPTLSLFLTKSWLEIFNAPCIQYLTVLRSTHISTIRSTLLTVIVWICSAWIYTVHLQYFHVLFWIYGSTVT